MKIKRIWQIGYSVLLVVFTVYVLLDAFVIPRSYTRVEAQSSDTASQQSTYTSIESQAEDTSSQAGNSEDESTGESEAAATPTITDTSYDDGNISIKIKSYREYDTDIYVADVTVSDPGALKTAFAQSIYGKNITDTTSSIASENNAVLAINGDYYGVRDGYVIRNGQLYRSSSDDKNQDDLVIGSDGSFQIIKEGEYSAEELLNKGASQILSFGPGLIDNGRISVDSDSEVDRAHMVSNPRTAIGILDELHYVFVVSDGRTNQSEGLSLYELAEFMQTLGVQTAYNLDGGGSSTMVFNGTVINKPTTGRSIRERAVSDIVYIG